MELQQATACRLTSLRQMLCKVVWAVHGCKVGFGLDCLPATAFCRVLCHIEGILLRHSLCSGRAAGCRHVGLVGNREAHVWSADLAVEGRVRLVPLPASAAARGCPRRCSSSLRNGGVLLHQHCLHGKSRMLAIPVPSV